MDYDLNSFENKIDLIKDRLTRSEENYKNLEKALVEKAAQLNYSIEKFTKLCDDISVKEVMLLERIVRLETEVKKLSEIHYLVQELDKKSAALESASGENKDRWNKIFTFVIQIIWVLLASWLLLKLGIQSPALP